jgi:threonine dehydrogenase-like Zn-dependent dehydrogenase
VILKVLSTNICGSDQHMVRGRTTAPSGLVLGHEITGEVIELGSDVETLKRATSYRCRSMWRAVVAAAARNSTPACACR